MSFSGSLNEQMRAVDCSAREFAEAAGLSHTVVNLYRSGTRTPAADSDALAKLLRGLEALAAKRGLSDRFPAWRAELLQAVPGIDYDFDLACERLKELMAALSVSNAALAHALAFDASLISRVLSGKRRPGNPDAFLRRSADFLAAQAAAQGRMDEIAALVGTPADGQIRAADAPLAQRIFDYLTSGRGDPAAEVGPADRFLQKLDEFDLNEYIREIRYDEIKVPTVPFQLPVRRSACSLEEMKAAEIEFLKLTALSRTVSPVMMYSEMPMEKMSEDADFSKKWLFGMAALLRKGLHLNMIHNVNRPLPEMMLGLEGWIPMYMTGQISPYYLDGPQSGAFLHLLHVSGAAALEGSAIAGHHENGRYYLTNHREELAHYARRAADLLSRAKPLMDIYDGDDAAFRRFLAAEFRGAKQPLSVVSSSPELPDEIREAQAAGRVLLSFHAQNAFRNIRILVCSGRWAAITKSKAPVIHFVIRHPKLVAAIERFEPPLLGL